MSLVTKQDIIKPKYCLKFNVEDKKHKEQITLQLEDIRGKAEIKILDHKIKNVTTVATSRWNKVGQKRKMYKIIDTVHIIRLENFEKYDKLNPITITLNDNDLLWYLGRFSKYKHRVIINNLLFSASCSNQTQVIHVTANRLTDANVTLLNGKVVKSLGQLSLNKVEEWGRVRGLFRWINIVFIDTEISVSEARHFGYGFATKSLNDLLNFNVIFLDGEGKLIDWRETEKKVPVLDFTIQIMK